MDWCSQTSDSQFIFNETKSSWICILNHECENTSLQDVECDIQVLTDVGPMMIDGSDTVPLSIPVVANTETQVDVRWGATLEVVPFVVGDGCPMGWLETESDGCVMEEVVLVPEMSPIVSMKRAVVPTFLPALSEVCSLAVLAGGSLLRQPPWPW